MIYSINFLTISPDLRQSLIWVSKTHRDHFVRLEGVTRMTTPHTQRCTLLWVVLLIGFYKLSVWAAFQLPHHTPSGPGNILYRGDGIGWWRSPHPETSAPTQTTPCHWGIWSWLFFRKTWNIPFYMCVCATEPEGPPYQRNYSLLTLKPLKHPRGANDKNAKTIIIEPWWIYQTIMCFNDRSVRRL